MVDVHGQGRVRFGVWARLRQHAPFLRVDVHASHCGSVCVRSHNKNACVPFLCLLLFVCFHVVGGVVRLSVVACFCVW